MKYFFTITIFLISAFCLVFPSDMVTASKNGLTLWLNIVVPSLLPFLILSDLIQKTAIPQLLSKLLNPLMRPLFKLPGASSLALILGMTGGYPIGAKVTSDLRKSEALTISEANRLIAFVNNSGPLFISAAIGVGLYRSVKVGFLLMAAHYLSAIFIGFIFRYFNHESNEEVSVKETFSFQLVDISNLSKVLTNSIKNGFLIISTIGGFILLFSIVSAILEKTGVLNILCHIILPGISKDMSKPLLVGILEVTNGVNMLAISSISINLKLIITSALVGFGGFSVHMQTLSVISDSDIKFSTYILGKFLQGIFSATITFLLITYTQLSSAAIETFSGVEYGSVGFYKLVTVITGLFIFSVFFKIIQTLVYNSKK